MATSIRPLGLEMTIEYNRDCTELESVCYNSKVVVTIQLQLTAGLQRCKAGTAKYTSFLKKAEI